MNRLLQQQLELPNTTAKYLRLTWGGNVPLLLDKVTAHFAATAEGRPRQWASFTATHDDPEQQAYRFDTQAYFPTERVRLQLPQRNSLVRAAIDVSSNSEGPWTPLYHGVVYDLQVEHTRLTTPPLDLGRRWERYWRVRLLDAESRLGGMPTLQLGWVPEQLLFIAQGNAPFTLAYGSSRVGPVTAPLAEFLRQETLQPHSTLLKAARLGAPLSLGGAAALQPITTPISWKRYILWMVLLLGVFALAFMARQLYTQMQQDRTDGSPP